MSLYPVSPVGRLLFNHTEARRPTRVQCAELCATAPARIPVTTAATRVRLSPHRRLPRHSRCRQATLPPRHLFISGFVLLRVSYKWGHVVCELLRLCISILPSFTSLTSVPWSACAGLCDRSPVKGHCLLVQLLPSIVAAVLARRVMQIK